MLVHVQARLEKLDVFKSDAIELAAGKVAALSGDIRRALQICRRSAEIAGERARATTGSAKGDKVTVHDINTAAQELATSQFVRAMQSAADWERGVLTCLYLHLTANGCEEAEFESVYHRMKSACLRKVPLGEEPTFGEVGLRSFITRIAYCVCESAPGIFVAAVSSCRVQPRCHAPDQTGNPENRCTVVWNASGFGLTMLSVYHVLTAEVSKTVSVRPAGGCGVCAEGRCDVWGVVLIKTSTK